MKIMNKFLILATILGVAGTFSSALKLSPQQPQENTISNHIDDDIDHQLNVQLSSNNPTSSKPIKKLPTVNREPPTNFGFNSNNSQITNNNSTGNYTGNGFFNGFRSFLASIVPTPLEQLLNSTADATSRTREELRRHYTRFTQFLKQYNKNYSSTELPRRFNLFVRRLIAIEKSAREYALGSSSFELTINKFIDWDDQEVKAMLNLKPPSGAELQSILNDPSTANETATNSTVSDNSLSVKQQGTSIFEWIGSYLSYGSSRPDVLTGESKDWRDSGCMGPVYNQKSCGACYVFSVLGVVEAQQCISDGKPLVRSSYQEVVDCSTGYGSNNGCQGGWPTDTFNYLRDKQTLSTEVCYPYVNKKGYCSRKSIIAKTNCTKSVAMKKTGAGRFILLHGEVGMKSHLDRIGPIVAVLEAEQSFTMYKRGVFEDTSCTKRKHNVSHGVVIVGYGEENRKKYWLVKNSWDTDWGEEGYFKIRRGVNECAIEHTAWGIPV